MKGSSFEALRRGLDPATRTLLDGVLAEAERREVAVHLVGGPVRDLLLGRGVRDLDLLVEPRDGSTIGADELARAAATPLGAQIVSHDRFGTVRLSAGDAALDVATTRKETYARPGALPSVAPGALEEDLRRRDFTVNALALPLSAAARRGRPAVVDPTGGRADLAAGVLRILHRASFADDPTRAVRAARLGVRLAFRLGRGSRSALRDAIAGGAFGGVSGERWRRELEKLFDDARRGVDPAAVLRLLDEWHVLAALEPGLGLPRTALPPLRRLGRLLADPPFPAPRLRPWMAGLAVWLAEVDATSRRRTLKRLAVRGEVAQRLVRFPKLRDRSLRALARARGRGAVDALLAPLDDDTLVALAAFAPPAGRRRLLRWALEDRGRRPPVGGSDLVAVGLAGPAVGVALARIRLAWLDGGVRTREEALALAREVGARVARRSRPRRDPARGRRTRRPDGGEAPLGGGSPEHRTRRASSAAPARASEEASLPAAGGSSILGEPSPPRRASRPEHG